MYDLGTIEKLAQMMIRCGLSTGHGDTIDDLIFELEKQIKNTLNAFSDAQKEIDWLREETVTYWAKYWDMAQAFERRGNALHRIASMRADPEFGAPPMATVQKIAQKALEKE